jgi:hypothetical protein
MKKLIIASISLLMLTTLVQAQNYAFKVMGNKGANEVKSGNNWEPLKIGTMLQPGDEIKVSPNAYIAMVHSSGKPLEWREAGTYKVANMEANVKAGSSVVNKYTDFILSNNSAESQKNRLSATGAVTRATGESIKVFLPGNQDAGLYNTYAIVSWHEENGSSKAYIVTLSSLFGDELMKIESDKTNVKLDLSNPRFASENAILISVTSKDNTRLKSQEFILKKLSASHYASVKSGLADILPDLAEETALNKFILAGFYEQNKLVVDALTAYKEAIALAPDVPTYEEAYQDFLVRNRLK